MPDAESVRHPQSLGSHQNATRMERAVLPAQWRSPGGVQGAPPIKENMSMNVLRRGALMVVCVLLVACVAAQTPAPASQGTAFDSSRAFEHLTRLVAIGPRPAGSPGAQKTRDYIKQQMQ